MKNQNRRSFIKAGTTLGASMLAASAWSMSSAKDASANEQKNSSTTIKFRTIGSGKHSLRVSSPGLGCMGMNFNRSFIPDKKPMIALLRKAHDMGVTLFDTAEAYGPFANEELVGEALSPVRKNIILCTKFGFNIQNGKLAGLNSKPENIRKVVEQSLKRLKTDHIDLLYQHRVDPNVPIEEVAGTVKEFIKEGKVLNFGLCEVLPETVRKAHAIQQVTAIQSEYSLMTRNPEQDVFAVCEELGIGFVPYSPLSRAYLTGYINERTKYIPANDNRPTLPRYQPDAIKANWPMIDLLAAFGNQRGLTAAQVALAWLLAQKPWIVPIPGTTKLAHLQENLGAAEIEFTADELKTLTDAISAVSIVGDRYTNEKPR